MKKYDINKQRVPSWDRYEQLYLQTTLTPEEQAEFENLRDNVINLHNPVATEWNDLIDDRDAVVDYITTSIPELVIRGDYVEKSVERLLMVNDNIVSATPTSLNSNKIYTDFVNNMDYSIGNVDTAKYDFEFLGIGVTSMILSSTPTFKKGQEVSIHSYKDMVYAPESPPEYKYENIIISDVIGSTVYFKTPTTNSYPTGGSIYRSNNKLQSFGDIAGITTLDITETIYTGSNTSYIGARNLVLKNKWQISITYIGVNIYIYVNKRDGLGWTRLCYIGVGSIWNISTSSYDNNIYIITIPTSGTKASFFKINAATQADVLITTSTSYLITSQSSFFSSSSISVDPLNGNIGFTCCSKNTAYPNSWNVVFSKSIDGGTTWVKQDGTSGFDQITAVNTTGTNYANPVLEFMLNNKPIIIHQWTNGTTYNIECKAYSTAWNNYTIISIASRLQQEPTINIQRYGSNIGRIEVAWSGTDNTDTTALNIRYTNSIDLGVSWSTIEKLTTGNTYTQQQPSIVSNQYGYTFIVFIGYTATNPSYRNIRYIYKDPTTWRAIVEVTNQNSVNQLSPSVCNNYPKFFAPMTTWYVQGTSFKFYGGFEMLLPIAPLKNIIRLNITNPSQFKKSRFFLTSDLASTDIVAKVSSQNNSTYEDENYSITLIESNVDLLNGYNELALYNEDSSPLVEKPNLTLKLELTRATTGTTKTFKSLLGSLNNTVASVTDRWILNSDDFAQPLINYVWDDSAIWDDNAIWKD